MANNFKRMQLIAGLITESEYRQSLINENKYDDMDNDNDDYDTTTAFKASPEFHSYEEVLDVIESYEDDEMLEDFKAEFPKGKDISREDYSDFAINYVDDMSEVPYIQANWISISDPDVYDKAGMNESQLNENKPYALLATVADDWGKDSDLYGDLEAAVIGWTDRNGELTPKGKIAIKNLLSNWDLLDDYGYFIDNEEMNEGDTDYDRAKDAKRLGKKGEKNIYGAGVEKGEEIEKKKMKMSELKAAIKELAEMDGTAVTNADYDPVAESVWSVLPDRIPEFIQKIKDIKDEYHAVVGSDDVYDGLDHAISAAEELMNSKLSEAKKDEEVEDSETIDTPEGDEEVTADITTSEVNPDVKAVQDSLTQAQAAAEKLGDKKLTDQIGNTITFFTRSHVVEKPGVTAESNIKERISKLVKSL